MATNARFKIDIYGDTANFENSLKGINSAMSNLKGEASQLRKELRLDPTNVKAMEKLQANLAQQLENTKRKASNLKQEMSNIDKSTPDGQKRWLTLQKQLSENSLKANALEGDIKEVGQAIQRGNWKADIDVSQAEGSISKVKKSFSALKEIGIGALRQIGSSAVSALGNGLRGWVSDAMDTQKAMLSLQNTMEFKGIGGGFQKLSSQMSKLATDTNANTEDTLKLATTFVGLGDTADVAGKKTTNLVKANQAFGGTGENLKGVVQAYGQMSAAGKVTAENINQLTDNNTALGSALKSTVMEMNPALKQYGSFAEASENGAVSIDMLDKAMGKLGKAGGGQVQTISDAWDSFNETVSLALLPALESLTPVITDIINSMSDAIPSIVDGISSIVDWLKQNWDWLSKTLIVIGSIIALVVGINAIASAFTAVATAVAFVLSPVGSIIIAIGAVIAIVVLLWQNWDTVWGAIKELASSFGQFFQDLWNGISSWFSGILTSIGTFFSNVWNGIKSVASNVASAVISFFQPWISFYSSIFNFLKSIANLVFQSVLAVGRGAWQGLQAVWSALSGFFSGIFNAVKNVVSSVFNAIGSFASSAWGRVSSAFSPVVGFFSNIFNSAKNAVSGALGALGGIAARAYGAITGAFNGIVGFFSDIFGSVARVVDNVLGGITGTIDKITSAVNGVAGKVKGFFGGSMVAEMRSVNLGASGIMLNSASAGTTNTTNTFNIQAGQMNTTALARAIKREIDNGRAG